MKIAIVGVIQPPSVSLSSHNAGNTYAIKSMAEELFGSGIEIQKDPLKWDDYDALLITEGVNYRTGKANLFGGVSDDLIQRLSALQNYLGDIYYFGPEVPKYKELVDKRLNGTVIQGVEYKDPEMECLDAFLQKKINRLVLGDSHSLSVFEKGWRLSRNDGKTMHGFLKEGLKSYVDGNVKHLRFYAGNIDVRHHLCRKFRAGELHRKTAIHEMVLELSNQLSALALESVEVVSLLPIEDDSRKIPKTGYYEGKPFYGSVSEREYCVKVFNESLEEMCNFNGFKFLKWEGLQDIYGLLDFDKMESKQSVHLAPKSYMFKKGYVWE